MDELERQLRSALTEMAGRVPPSHDAWAEHQRRLARQKSRRPVLMVAAAAAVVALIAIPVLLLNMRPAQVTAANPSETSAPRSESTRAQVPEASGSSPKPSYVPSAGETLLTEPVMIEAMQNVGGQFRAKYGYTVRRADNSTLMCLADVTGTSAVINGDKSSVCVAMNAPRAGRVVWLKYNVPSQMGSSLIVFVASHPTDNVLMRTSQGYYTSAAKVADGPDFGFFLGYTNNPTAYTARDKANVTLENG
jgi:hypothetical protein